MTTKNRRPKGEGSIFQRADGKWVGRLTYEDPETGLRKRTQVSGDTKKAASAALKALRDRVDKKLPPRDDKGLFGAYAEQWVKTTLEVSDRKQSTKTLYAGLARTHIIDGGIGKVSLDRLTAPAVERFVVSLRKKGLSESTVRQIYTVGRAIADAAVRDSLLSVNPFGLVKRPKVTKAEAAHLEAGEVARLLEVAAKSRYGVVMEFLVNTGLRRGEALALRWADVDMTNRTARVRGTLVRQDGELVTTPPKSASSVRTIPLTDAAVGILQRVKVRTAEDRLRAGSRWSDSGYVFVTEFGEPSDPRNALRALKTAAEAVGMPGVGLHTLRHTAATLMLTNGVPMAVVSKVMGHSGIAITVDTYGHVSPDVSRDAFDALSSALGRA